MTGETFNLPAGALFPHGGAFGHFPEWFHCRGDRRMLDLPRACVLNSRKPRSVTPDDCWLKATRACVEAAAADGYALVSSVGNLAYNWVSFLAAKNKLPLILALDSPLPLEAEEDIPALREFSGLFDPRRTLIVSPFTHDSTPRKKLGGPIRDACVASMSHALWAAEIRSGGIMEKILTEAADAGRRVIVFRPDRYDSRTAGNKRLLDSKAVPFAPFLKSPAPLASSSSAGPMMSADALEDGAYLFHFTRSCPGPWPGQSWREYLTSLDRGEPGAAHRVLDTLLRIVREGRIRGGSRLIRGRDPMVSLTARAPQEMAELASWNRSLIRWSFEPYGIAIHREAWNPWERGRLSMPAAPRSAPWARSTGRIFNSTTRPGPIGQGNRNGAFGAISISTASPGIKWS